MGHAKRETTCECWRRKARWVGATNAYNKTLGKIYDLAKSFSIEIPASGIGVVLVLVELAEAHELIL